MPSSIPNKEIPTWSGEAGAKIIHHPHNSKIKNVSIFVHLLTLSACVFVQCAVEWINMFYSACRLDKMDQTNKWYVALYCFDLDVLCAMHIIEIIYIYQKNICSTKSSIWIIFPIHFCFLYSEWALPRFKSICEIFHQVL